VEVAGEFVTLPANLGAREAVRAAGEPGSAWIIDLRADNQPVETLLAEVGDAEFARDYVVEAAGSPETSDPFVYVGSGQWRRRAGEARKPFEAALAEQPASRLRLLVNEYRKTPLEFIVGPLRLYYGNPQAEPPHYDLERQLAPQLDPPPVRLALGTRQTNPQYVPEPPALSERWPWLIYGVLAAACLALGAVLINLGRTAVARHDAPQSA
jgi:hypothetical protein